MRHLLPCLLLLACVGRRFPGNEVMGTFDFTATFHKPVGDECKFAEMPTEDFTFTGTFSRTPIGAEYITYFTLNDTDRAASFDGQIAISTAVAARRFDACACPDGTNVDEALTVALLSSSQRDALPDPLHCPDDPLGTGIPPVAGGVTAPQSESTGFNAVLACGNLLDHVLVAPDACACNECSVRYALEGVRK